MNKFMVSLIMVTVVGLNAATAWAQTPISNVDNILYPLSIRTSADNLTLSVQDRCTSPFRAPGTQYRVAMAANNITVTIGLTESIVCPTGLIQPNREFDLGRLPAGNYTLTVIAAAATLNSVSAPAELLIDKAPFTVIDAREPKARPYVRLNYSGHWWDPNDPGWGLFIWHDANSPTDNMLAAWFSYTPDGKPMWYVFQPKWSTASITVTTDLLQGSRLPGATSPPPTIGNFMAVGTATLNFEQVGTVDEGKIAYSFANGATFIRTIRRFRP